MIGYGEILELVDISYIFCQKMML